MGRQRNEKGRFVDRIPEEWVLEIFEEREDKARPLTASDVIEELGCSRRTAHNKLGELVKCGELETRKVGAKGRVWWVPLLEDRGDEIDRGTVTAARDEPLQGEGVEEIGTELGRSTTLEDESDVIDSLNLPGSGSNLEGRRKAARQIYDYLREEGSGRRSDFREVVDIEATGYASFDSFYTNCIGNGAVLKELPGVESPGEGGHHYTYSDS